MSGHVGASLAELLELFGKPRTFELNGRFDDGDEVVMGHHVRGKAYDFEIGREKTSSFLKAHQVCHTLGGTCDLTRPNSAGNYIKIFSIESRHPMIHHYQLLLRKVPRGT